MKKIRAYDGRILLGFLPKKTLRIMKLTLILSMVTILQFWTTEAYSQQQKQITGIVSDKNGPIPGVNVVVTGSTIGAITDMNGKYSLQVPPESKSLTFTFMGMETQVVTIGASANIDVTMTETAIGLNEVVVIGYGTAKKEDLTGAVVSVKAE